MSVRQRVCEGCQEMMRWEGTFTIVMGSRELQAEVWLCSHCGKIALYKRLPYLGKEKEEMQVLVQ